MSSSTAGVPLGTLSVVVVAVDCCVIKKRPQKDPRGVIHRAGVPLGTLGGLSIAISWSIVGRYASGFAGESEPLQGSASAKDSRSADGFWL